MTKMKLSVDPSTVSTVAEWRQLEIELVQLGRELHGLRSERKNDPEYIDRITERFERVAASTVSLKDKAFNRLLADSEIEYKSSMPETVAKAAASLSEKANDRLSSAGQIVGETMSTVGDKLSVVTKSTGKHLASAFSNLRGSDGSK